MAGSPEERRQEALDRCRKKLIKKRRIEQKREQEAEEASDLSQVDPNQEGRSSIKRKRSEIEPESGEESFHSARQEEQENTRSSNNRASEQSSQDSSDSERIENNLFVAAGNSETSDSEKEGIEDEESSKNSNQEQSETSSGTQNSPPFLDWTEAEQIYFDLSGATSDFESSEEASIDSLNEETIPWYEVGECIEELEPRIPSRVVKTHIWALNCKARLDLEFVREPGLKPFQARSYASRKYNEAPSLPENIKRDKKRIKERWNRANNFIERVDGYIQDECRAKVPSRGLQVYLKHHQVIQELIAIWRQHLRITAVDHPFLEHIHYIVQWHKQERNRKKRARANWRHSLFEVYFKNRASNNAKIAAQYLGLVSQVPKIIDLTV